MKRFVMFTFFVAALSLLSFGVPAMAKSHKIRAHGTVEAIDTTASCFVLKQQDGAKITFSVDQRTEFEVETQNTRHDMDVPFSDLKVGDSVRVKAYPGAGQQNPLADDVEIYR